jgi:ubiquinone/menaquinone biosynthesis C-methylase UbiE
MGTNHHLDKWTGVSGRFHAWFFGTYTRKALEILLFGNYWSAFRREMAKRIRNGNEIVLDIGSGSGNFSLPIARKMKQGKVICLDLSTEMTDSLQAKAVRQSLRDRIRILTCDARETTLEDNSVDWIVSGNCMHEMSDPQKVWAEMHRVLKPNGALFIVDFRDKHGYEGENAHGPYSVHQMNELFAGADFRNISVKPKGYFVVGVATK